jgi:hypothetical protein
MTLSNFDVYDSNLNRGSASAHTWPWCTTVHHPSMPVFKEQNPVGKASDPSVQPEPNTSRAAPIRVNLWRCQLSRTVQLRPGVRTFQKRTCQPSWPRPAAPGWPYPHVTISLTGGTHRTRARPVSPTRLLLYSTSLPCTQGTPKATGGVTDLVRSF